MAKADEICLDHHHPKIGREKPSNSSLIRCDHHLNRR
ncbi:unnamed protein product [Arabidopsis lyrata]|nr:unnamed protein product [Arabidopsis lyrata]